MVGRAMLAFLGLDCLFLPSPIFDYICVGSISQQSIYLIIFVYVCVSSSIHEPIVISSTAYSIYCCYLLLCHIAMLVCNQMIFHR